MKGESTTRQMIIEKAALVINQKGMAGTAISDIMAATKLAKGGIYGNFESKEEICQEVFKYLTQRLTSAIDNALRDKPTAKAKLKALLEFYRDVLPAHNGGGCPLLNFGVEADDTNPIIRGRVGEAIQAAESRITNLVTAGIQAGEFDPSVNARHFAVKMFTMIEGAILVTRVLGNPQQMKIVTDILAAEIDAFSL
ncbi:TetR/AcrR family transcriptional regulator [Chitinophaga pendula]|uniref:TetR/AcrR family transcriptional regulator n=1 Tax=Chitinophaga TaxID=79328 RepID=UPI000BAED355|nr:MULTISPECIES: TetR/AcrR family transcriptional regulator [Chitinophaga]ASZ12224.1 TetR family transcriptional regulator [Chitinophaga sp. MD30]UCJ04745.1 TetR/AcrR family transcriptional regulator [Chitinophaga pendula]